MSAFVVDTATMDRCVTGLLAKTKSGYIFRRFLDVHTDDHEAGTQIGRRLFTLNIEAVQQRYPDTLDNPNSLPGSCDEDGNSTVLSDAATYAFARKDWRSGTSRKALCDSYKALTCLRYQCSEGNVPERPEYVALSEAIGELASAIVESLPEYEAAAWG